MTTDPVVNTVFMGMLTTGLKIIRTIDDS